jgi:hypothetical protein
MRMSEEQFIEIASLQVPAAPPVALPVVTFDDSVTLHLNGDRLEVMHVGEAHTDGDAVLWWQSANVVHTGDVYDSSSSGGASGRRSSVEAASGKCRARGRPPSTTLATDRAS